jgi:hypothetical protein
MNPRPNVRAISLPPEGGLEKHMLHRLRTAVSVEDNLRTMQSWMGHTDPASTMRYFRSARGEKVQAQVGAL